MKRVVIPIENKKLSEYLFSGSHFDVFDIDENKIIRQVTIGLPVTNIVDLPEWASNENITDIITHKISKKIINLFSSRKVNLFVGIPQIDSLLIINKYIRGSLFSNHNIITQILEKNNLK